MAHSTEDFDGNLLDQPLSIGELISGGTQFEVNTNFEDNLPDEMFDDLNIQDSDGEEGDCGSVLSPWDKSFNELRLQMTMVDENIYKRIVHEGNPSVGAVMDRARVVIQYNAYWEHELAPFDSTYMRGKPHIFECGKGDVLEGLEAAVRTMYKGEESQFLISYNLLFREMGCPPRVKPKADGLFIIKLIDFIDVGNDEALDDIPAEDRIKFSVIFDKVKKVHLKGLDFFKKGNTINATKSFHKAVKTLEFCRVANETEQEAQQDFLVKLYTNLAVCYNRLNLPKKTCSMCNELRNISDIKKNCKALFQEGRALFMLGEFHRARNRLVTAQNLEPNNIEITNELKALNRKHEEYTQNERETWQRAMGIINNSEKANSNLEELDEFKEGIRSCLEDFSKKESPTPLTLPQSLSSEEITCIEQLSKEFGLKVTVTETAHQKTYKIAKDSRLN